LVKQLLLRLQLRSQRGSVTAEAAIGVVLISMTSIMCVQLLLIGVQQIRLSAVAAEASRIAAASGDLLTRLAQAKEYASQEFDGSHIQVTSNGSRVIVDMSCQPRVFLLPFAPVVKAHSESPLLDSLAVM